MSQSRMPQDSQQFAELVHDALGKLYDTLALQQHPLASFIDPAPASPLQCSQNLRRQLLASIQALRPAPGTPAASPDWRAYRLLEWRYIEGLDPQEVMKQLGLAKSQYYREQARVIAAVANILWEKYQTASAARALDASRQELIRTEAERLSTHSAHTGVDDAELLADLTAIVQPLAHALNVEARIVSLRGLRGLVVDRVVLRQALLVAISALLNVEGVQHLEVDSCINERGRSVQMQAWPSGTETLSPKDIGLCRSLVEPISGAVRVVYESHILEVRLEWPLETPRSILVIDDNAGMAELFRRYLAGSPWQVLSAEDGLQAREMLADTRPQVIILDVMMPREDGWEFLLNTRNSRRLKDIPIIVCSVLDQPNIALTLGAAAYLPKPVTQESLLKALAPWSI